MPKLSVTVITKNEKKNLAYALESVSWADELIVVDCGSEVFEFRSEDIVYAEELSSLSKPNGVTVEQVRLWVRKGSPAMRMEPVRVGNDS